MLGRRPSCAGESETDRHGGAWRSRRAGPPQATGRTRPNLGQRPWRKGWPDAPWFGPDAARSSWRRDRRGDCDWPVLTVALPGKIGAGPSAALSSRSRMLIDGGAGPCPSRRTLNRGSRWCQRSPSVGGTEPRASRPAARGAGRRSGPSRRTAARRPG